jgi:holo-[acyl-carrier protein] synthase
MVVEILKKGPELDCHGSSNVILRLPVKESIWVRGGSLIVGIGIDLIEIPDFARSLLRGGDAYTGRLFTTSEVTYCRALADANSSFAARFSAKEAAIKALGLAGKDGLNWHDFEVSTDSSGRPVLNLYGVAASQASEQKVDRLTISLTHSRTTAAAVVIAESTVKV